MAVIAKTKKENSSVPTTLFPPVGFPRTVAQSTIMPRWYSPLCEKEKRQCTRRSLRCEIALIATSVDERTGPLVIPAECLNVSDGGLYGIVPIGFGVAMGQSYNFRLTIGERGPEPGTYQVISQKGIIVRTELLLGESGSGDRVGIGVRLIGHRSGVLPMPSRV